MSTLVFITDSPLMGSSFGVVTDQLCKRLSREYNIFVLGIGYQGYPLNYHGYTVLPLKDLVQIDFYLKKMKYDIPILFHSFYLLEQMAKFKSSLFFRKKKPLLYIPVEGTPIPQHSKDCMVDFERIMVPSKFSQKILKENGIKADVIPHGVDTQIFTPQKNGNGNDVFNFGYLGQNDLRKQVCRVMRAYKQVERKYPSSKFGLTLHTKAIHHYDLAAIAKQLEIVPIFSESCTYDLPISEEKIREFYWSLSTYVSPATEGFGLPPLEAAACGIPIVGLDHGAVPEIFGDAMLKVKLEAMLETNVGKVGLVDENDLALKMQHIFYDYRERKRLIKKGFQVVKEYNWNNGVRKFKEILEEELE